MNIHELSHEQAKELVYKILKNQPPESTKDILKMILENFNDELKEIL